MSGKWFANRGQIGQFIVAILAFLLALLIAWPQLSPHMDLLSLWPLVIVPLAAFVVFRLGRLSKSTEIAPKPPVPLVDRIPDGLTVTPPPPRPILAETEKRYWMNDDNIVFQRKTVKLGEYWELKEGMARLKITPIAINEVEKKPLRAELRIDTGGSMYYGGEETVTTGTNRIALAQTSSGFQAEPHCAYQFSFSEDHVHFAAIRVDHINKFGSQVDIEVCLVSMHKTSKLEWTTPTS